MNSLIENLNLWGERFLHFAWPMLWQSSLLIAVLFALDFALRRKVRASVRYALWLVVMVKLLLPPTLAVPTSIAWWVRPSPTPKPQTKQYIVTYFNGERPQTASDVQEMFAGGAVDAPEIKLSSPGWFIVASGIVSIGLLTWMILRWRHVARVVRCASPVTEAVTGLLNDAKRNLSVRRGVQLRLTNQPMSPAVCGLFRPGILLPRALAEKLPPNQLRAVLLHELVHLRRGDVWVNCLQAMLQIAYWWHPLLWLANARIRRLREEAVDDAVMVALASEADSYAPTLLEVAKLTFNRPLASLGLVGILESRSALRQRIKRLVDFRPPRKAGLTIASLVCVVAFTALAVPMGEPPPRAAKESQTEKPRGTNVLSTELNANHNFRASETLFTRTLKFDPEVFLPNLRQRMHLPDKSTDGEIIGALPSFLADIGLDMQPPCTVMLKERGLTQFHAPQAKIEAIERLFTELNNGRPQSEIPNPGHPPDRETIIRKLDQIQFDSPTYNEAPLIEVIRDLSWETKRHDPEKKGLSFRTKYSASAGKMVDLSAVKVTVPTFSNARLSELLEAIVKGADKPIKYYIWAGVAFYSTEDEPVLPMGMTMAKASGVSKGRESLSSSTATEASPAITTTNGLFEAAALKLLHEITPGSKSGGSLFFQVEVREDGSYWTQNKRMNLAELRDWLSQTQQPDRAATVRFEIHTNAPPESKRALSELCKELGMSPDVKLGSVRDSEKLYVRTFKVTTNTFYKGLESAGSLPLNQTNVGTAMRDFFMRLGVDLSPPKSVFYSDGSGLLMVRATIQELDTIESAIQVLNAVTPQVNIKAKFVEVPIGEAEKLMAMIFTNAPVGGTNGFTGILTKPQADKLMKAIKSTAGVEIMGAPEVTTLSGRQAQIQIVDLKTIVTGLTPVFTNGVTNLFPRTDTMPFGSVLDVTPHVSADGYTIQMTLVPTVTEFLGYDEVPGFVKTAVGGRLKKEQLPLPKIRVRQITTTSVVWDGQTLVLGNFPDKELTKLPNGKEALKDVSSESKKQLLVFVTPTIVDPAGNRVHVEEELPFARESVPPQKPVR